MAVTLNGVDQAVDFGVDAVLAVNPPFAIYAEVSTTETGVLRIVNRASHSAGWTEWAIETASSPVRFRGRWAYDTDPPVITTALITGGTTVNDGTVHRVLFYTIIDGADTELNLFVDGVQDTATVTVVGDTTTHLGLGGSTRVGAHEVYNSGAGGPGDFTSGVFSNVAVFDRQFSLLEAADITDGATTPRDYASDLLAWWPLGYGPLDDGPNGVDGTNLGNPSYDGSGDELNGSLPGLEADLEGDTGVPQEATLGAVLPALEARFQGNEVEGELVASLPGLTALLLSEVSATEAELVASLPGLRASISGDRRMAPHPDVSSPGLYRAVGWRAFPAKWPLPPS